MQSHIENIQTKENKMRKLQIIVGLILALSLTACANKEVERSASQERAQEIMGKNFFGIEEAVTHFEVKPSKQQISALAEVPFTKEVLESHKDTHILVAVFPMSILDIKKMDNKLFYPITGAWFESRKFAKSKGTTSWQLVRKTPVEDSMSKTWKEQQVLLSKDDETPSARVMVYTIIGHYMNTGETLFRSVCVRTSSVGFNDVRVYVGLFYAGGLFLNGYWDNGRFDHLGTISARKP